MTLPVLSKNSNPLRNKRLLKTALFLVLYLMVTPFLNAQSITPELYANMVAFSNKHDCPKVMVGLVINSVSYDTNYLHFDMTLEEDYRFGRTAEQIRTHFANLIRYRIITDFIHLYERLVDLKGGLIYDILTDSTKTHYLFQYDPDEMRELWADRSRPEFKDSTKWCTRYEIMSSTYYLTKSGPIQTDGNSFLDSMRLVADTFFYYYTVHDNEAFRIWNYLRTKQQIRNRLQSDLAFYYGWVNMATEAEIDIVHLYHDTAGNEVLRLHFPLSELRIIQTQSKQLKPADDEILDAFIREQIVLADSLTADWSVNDSLNLMDIRYADQTIQRVYSFSKEHYGDGVIEYQLDALKNYYAAKFHNDFFYELVDTFAYHGHLITLDDFFRRLKGVQFLYIEEGTRRTVELFISSDEIRNSPELIVQGNDETYDLYVKKMIEEKLVSEIQRFSEKELPSKVEIGTFDSIRWENNVLHYHFTVSNKYRIIFEDSTGLNEYLHRMMKISDAGEPFAALIDLNADFICHYHSPDGKKEIKISYSAAQLEDFFFKTSQDQKRQEARSTLYKDFILKTNKVCPYLINLFTVLDSVSITDNMMVFHYGISGEPGAALFYADENDVRWGIQTDLLSRNGDSNLFLPLCKTADYGICYHYYLLEKKKSGKKSKRAPKRQKRICFSAEEVKEFAEQY